MTTIRNLGRRSTRRRLRSARRLIGRAAAVTAAVCGTGAATASTAGAQYGYVEPLMWYRSSDGMSILTSPSSTSTFGPFGTAGDIGIIGGYGNIGVWRPSDGIYRFDMNDDLATDLRVAYGTNGDIPLTSSQYPSEEDFLGPYHLGWQYGFAFVNFRPSDNKFRIDYDLNGRTDRTVRYGTAGDIPLSGDFDADGDPDVAVWRPSDQKFRFDLNLDGRTDRTIRFGTTGDQPFASGSYGNSPIVATYRPSDQRIRTDTNGDGTTDRTRALAPNEIGVSAGAALIGLGNDEGY